MNQVNVGEAFNAATGLSHLSTMLAVACLVLITIFFASSSLLGLRNLLRMRGEDTGPKLWMRLLVVMGGISLILLFFSMMSL
ncbi:hypothetical protein [Cardiobacterium valvarum]|uniref:Uncharacterized protein n=1 Tax=Cardiobacterium valvarum F0432 TaxID=797473 RepID=G9ZJ98_9GAMM|nr:hypothetical protein [Cardiobacterium valvarum]EHM50239.1 hypothetical protein HMPREF9080_02867 [Cardiobacterium valvarum F0432]